MCTELRIYPPASYSQQLKNCGEEKERKSKGREINIDSQYVFIGVHKYMDERGVREYQGHQ